MLRRNLTTCSSVCRLPSTACSAVRYLYCRLPPYSLSQHTATNTQQTGNVRAVPALGNKKKCRSHRSAGCRQKWQYPIAQSFLLRERAPNPHCSNANPRTEELLCQQVFLRSASRRIVAVCERDKTQPRKERCCFKVAVLAGVYVVGDAQESNAPVRCSVLRRVHIEAPLAKQLIFYGLRCEAGRCRQNGICLSFP